MSRPKKQTVDYFPHYCDHKTTMFILEQRYGNDGYAFWFKLLEVLGKQNGHWLDLRDTMRWEFLQAKTRLSEETTVEMLNLLAKLEAIDPELWKIRVVWSANFIDGISEVYRNRRVETPQRPAFLLVETTQETDVSTPEKPHSKVKESKVKEIKYTPDFLEFYETYPNKVDRADAFKAWKKLDPQNGLRETILSAIQNQSRYKKYLKDKGEFCPEWPHPSTWLNKRRWEDEIPKVEESRWFK